MSKGRFHSSWRPCAVCSCASLWCWRFLGAAASALFSVVPVPFSAVMVERQISAWLQGDFGYVAHSDWAGMDEISPWMGLAVIAAEDQKFPEHWGFDVSAIEKALAHNERNENRIRGASTLSQQTAKNLFLWDGRTWVRKGLGGRGSPSGWKPSGVKNAS